MKRRQVYLDHAAATPMDKAVIDAMIPFFSDDFHNPAASYKAARDTSRAIAGAKARIGSILGVKPSELILTSGGTEANNLAIAGVMQRYSDKKALVSSIEHESVTEPASRWKNNQLDVDKAGILDVDKALSKINDDVVLISVMLANNEVGTIQPLRQLAQRIKSIRRDRLKRKVKLPLFFHTDACQAPLYLDTQPHRLGVDLMTLNGGKIYGPKQAGLLYVAAGINIAPLILGGGQQRGLRSGTESPAAAVGMATALEIAAKKRRPESERLRELQEYFIVQIKKEFTDAIINGHRKNRLPSNVHITLPGRDNERLINQLDEAGIMVAAGSACSASNEESSHVLKAMGIRDEDARSSLRITMGRSTTKTDVDYFVRTLASISS